jgi:hypothetical protein
MSRLGWTALAIGCLLWQTPALAAGITVSGERPRDSITVTIENATIDLVLEDLRKRYGFDVAGLDKASKSEAMSATISGSLQSVLERLLRNFNHVIVRAPDNESGIAKVMILDAAYGALPPKVEQAKGRGGADNLTQALSGED